MQPRAHSGHGTDEPWRLRAQTGSRPVLDANDALGRAVGILSLRRTRHQWAASRTQDSLPAAGQALPGGLSTRRVPTTGFQAASFWRLGDTMLRCVGPKCQAEL